MFIKSGEFGQVPDSPYMCPATTSFDYKSLLSRAKKELPEPKSSGERWETPQLDVMTEGRATVIRNWPAIVEKLRRDPQHLVTYLLRELGTAGGIEGERVTFQGNLIPRTIQERLESYVQTYVICSECGRPDTHLDKQERTTLLKCEACGAHKPIVTRRVRAAPQAKPTLEENKVYELNIDDISQRGDGVARHLGFTIFVPGGKKGQRYRILIEKTSGGVAFGRIQP